MSVINNVLKDLETRESSFAPIEIPTLERRADSRPALLPLLLVGVVLLLLAVAGWYYLQNQPGSNPTPVSNNESPLAEIVEPIVSTAAAVEIPLDTAAVPEAITPNQIIGLQIRETDDEMRLEFALREKVVAYPKQRGENNFGYHLRDIESQIVAPVLSKNRWLRRLSIVAENKGIDILFKTSADILVETRQAKIDGEHIWSISFRKSTPPEPIALVGNEAQANSLATQINEPQITEPVEDPVVEVESPQAAVQEPVKVDIKSTNPNAGARNQLAYATRLINSGRHTDAENLLLSLLQGTEDYTARTHLLALYNRHNRVDRLAPLALDSMKKYPEDAIFSTEYARLLFQAKTYRGVIQLFADSSSLNADQQALVAASYQRLDQHQDAIEYYLLALEQDASNPKNWIGLGISQEHSAALEDALHSYQTAAELGNLNNRLQAFVEKRSETLKQVLN